MHVAASSNFRCEPFADMNKADADCSELIKQTAAALDSEAMQQLFVSTQRNILELCAKYALERSVLR
jgi:hypothetical protein